MKTSVLTVGICLLVLSACGDEKPSCLTRNAVRDKDGVCVCPPDRHVEVSTCVLNDASVEIAPSSAIDARVNQEDSSDSGRKQPASESGVVSDASDETSEPDPTQVDSADAAASAVSSPQAVDAAVPTEPSPAAPPDSGMPTDTMTPSCMPSAETCDGVDNDCDGMVDEEVTRPCGISIVPCKQGVLTCHNGKWDDESVCKGAIGPTSEVCDGASKDENCNGVANEGCGCVNGETKPCGNNTPPCKQGTLTCTNGVWPMTCVGEVKGSPETCDDVDNNCDGKVDEGFVKGGACTAGRGECLATGTLECNSVGVVACSAVAKAVSTTEFCDTKDNDCDGMVDELLSNACGGPCGAPVPKEDCSTPADDNCNGQVNEGCVPPCGDGQLGTGEECDPGASGVSPWTCSRACKLLRSYTTCATDLQCQAGKCLFGICTLECAATSECPPVPVPTVAKPTCFPGVSFLNPPIPQMCGLGGCTTNSDCPPYQICDPAVSTGPATCKPVTCGEDSHCPTGQVCRGTSWGSYCMPPL